MISLVRSGRFQRLTTGRRPRRCTRLQTQVREDLLPQLQQRLPIKSTLAQIGWIAAGLLLVGFVKSLQGH